MKEARTQIIFVICFLVVWQIVYEMQAFSELIFPSLKDIGQSFIDGFREDSLFTFTMYSMSLILKGLAIGIILACLFCSIAGVCKTF